MTDKDALAAADLWWVENMNTFPGFMATGAPVRTPRYVYEIFAAGATWGRAKGMEEAAEIAESEAFVGALELTAWMGLNERKRKSQSMRLAADVRDAILILKDKK